MKELERYRVTGKHVTKHPLTTARESRGISQSKLGLAVGINPVRLSEIESWRRYPCPSWRDRLSTFLNIPEHELFPKPDDLIEMVRYLTEENQRLQLELEAMRRQPGRSVTRDNTRYL